MAIFMNVIYFVVGVGGCFLFTEIWARRRKHLHKVIKALKKKQFVALLETDKAIYFRVIKKVYRNLAITEQKEIIVLPKSSPKPCINIGGGMLVHADLYKSVAVPQEIRQFIHDRKKEGWKEEDIAEFLEEVETTPPSMLKKRFFDLKFPKLKKKEKTEVPKPSNPNLDIDKIDKRKFDVYINLPSVVKDFIYTGLNRVSIHAMLREIVYQRELEKIGKRNWLAIAIAIMIILLGVGFGIRFILGTPGVMESITKGVSRIAP